MRFSAARQAALGLNLASVISSVTSSKTISTAHAGVDFIVGDIDEVGQQPRTLIEFHFGDI